MVRIEVATMVWSRAPRNIPIMSPPRIVTIWRCVGATLGRAGTGTAAAAASTGGVDEWEVWDTGTSRGCAATDGFEAGVEPTGSGERGGRNTRPFPVKVHNYLLDDTIPRVRHGSSGAGAPVRHGSGPADPPDA